MCKQMVGGKRREMERSVSSCKRTFRMDDEPTLKSQVNAGHLTETTHLATLLSIAGPGVTNIIKMQVINDFKENVRPCPSRTNFLRAIFFAKKNEPKRNRSINENKCKLQRCQVCRHMYISQTTVFGSISIFQLLPLPDETANNKKI